MFPRIIALFFLLSGSVLAYADEGKERSGGTSPHMLYSVQVASFLERERAVSHATKLRDAGYNPYILMIYDTKNRPWYTVHLENFSNKQRAQAAATAFHVRRNQRALVFATDSDTFAQFLARTPQKGPAAEDTETHEHPVSMDPSTDAVVAEMRAEGEETLALGENEPAVKQEPSGADSSSDTTLFGWLTRNERMGYIVAGVGFSRVDLSDADVTRQLGNLDNVTASVDQSSVGWKLVGGYKINQYFSLEGGYVNLGEVKVRVTTSNDADTLLPAAANVLPVSVHGGMLEAVGYWQAIPSCAVLGKGGGFLWRGETEIVTGTGERTTRDTHGTDLVLGFGGQCQISQRNALRIEWERFFLENDRDFLSASIEIMF